MRKHSRMILVMLTVLCAVVAVALYAREPTNMPAQYPSQPKDQTAPAGTVAQPAEVSDAVASVATDVDPRLADPAPAASETTGTQSSESTQVDEPADNAPADANVPAANATASTEKPTATEDLKRQMADQMSAAISHAEKPKISPNAAYEPGVVLISVRKGTTAAQVAQAMADAGVKDVDHNDIEVVTDDLMKVKLAPNASIDDAILSWRAPASQRAHSRTTSTRSLRSSRRLTIPPSSSVKVRQRLERLPTSRSLVPRRPSFPIPQPNPTLQRFSPRPSLTPTRSPVRRSAHGQHQVHDQHPVHLGA